MARQYYFEVLPRHPSDSLEAMLAADRLRDGAYLMAATTAAARLIAPGELRLAHYPPDLLACAYANLGALNPRKAEFKECPGCARAHLPGS